MDPSVDVDTKETGQHQSTTEQADVEDVKPQIELSENPTKTLIEPEVVSTTKSDSPLPSPTSSLAGVETKSLPTEEIIYCGPEIDKEKDKLPVLSEDSSFSIPTKEMPKESSGSSSSSMTSSTTTIEEVKQMSRRQLATVLILCFVNLLKYMDRFTIAGMWCLTVCLCDIKVYLVLLQPSQQRLTDA